MAGDSDDDLGLADTADSPNPGAAAGTPPAAKADLSTVGPPMVARPEADKLARAVARSRVAEKLFAKKQEVKLGRYHLLEQVGAGGMGVVWGAWDPELDRRVAIKLVKATMLAARDRILAEGQALAKLSHPNVVPVYDVGVVDDQIYIVMEWVRGKNLRAWCREPRTVREIVAIYRAAGEGLWAAHRAGLIHRDFKPDNAILGDDGRVRVLDFGLARGEVKTAADSDPGASQASSDLTRGAGTPRYMPPEQAEGRELSAAVDQYALGVSLREALTTRNGHEAPPADVPRWLDEIITRSTAREASARYPAMDALVHALALDPARVWRRRFVVAGAVAVAGAAFAVGQFRASGDAVEPCVGARDEIARTWSASARGKLAEHLRGLGAYGAEEAQRLDPVLAKYSTDWADAHRGACLAQQRGELTPTLYERTLGCLTRARVALETVVEVLSTVEEKRLPDAAVAAGGLPNANRCVGDTQTSTVEPPAPALAPAVALVGNEVESARIRAVAELPNAPEVAAAALSRARQIGYQPLVARAALVEGLAWVNRDVPRSITPFRTARDLAFEAGDAALAIEAYARAIFAISVTDAEGLPPGAKDELGGIPMAEAIAKSLGAGGRFERALFYSNAGSVRYHGGDRAAARPWYKRALDESETVTINRFELVQTWINIAQVTDTNPERGQYYERGIQENVRELGPDHPFTLDARVSAAWETENPQRAAAALREPCDRLRALHPQLGEKLDACAYEVGWLFEELGERDQARVWLQRVRKGLRSVLAKASLDLFDAHYDAVGHAMREQIAKLGKRTEFWQQIRLAEARSLLARSELALGHRDAAIDQLQQALTAVQSTATAIGTSAWYRRHLAHVEMLLARALAPKDRAAAARHAAVAAGWFRQVGGYDAQLAELAPLTGGSR